jgi:hypothetical protein
MGRGQEEEAMKWKMRPSCPPEQVVPLRPLRSMREKCLDCCCGQVARVRDCLITGCAIWPYRFGRNPNRKTGAARPMSPEHKRKLLEGRARARAMSHPPALRPEIVS